MATTEKNAFQIQMQVDAQSALATLQKILDESLKLDSVIGETKKIEIDASEAKDSLEEIAEGQKKIIGLGLDLKTAMNRAFDIGKITLFGFALTEIYNGFKALYEEVSNTAEELVDLDNTAQGFLMSANSLKAWEVTFKELGYNAKEADDILGSLSEKLLDLRFSPDKDFANALSILGIKSTLDPQGNTLPADEIIKEFQNKIFQPGKTAQGNPTDPRTGGVMSEDLYKGALMYLHISIDEEKAKTMYNKGRSLVTEIEDNEKKNIVTFKETDTANPLVKSNADLAAQTDKLKYAIETPLMTGINKLIPYLKIISDFFAKFMTTELAHMLGIQPNDPNVTAFADASGKIISLGTQGILPAIYQYIDNNYHWDEKKAEKLFTTHKTAVDYVIDKESQGKSNAVQGGKGKIKHSGAGQYTDSTWVNGGGKLSEMFNPNAQRERLGRDAENFKNKYHIDPDENPQMFAMEHMLGQGDYEETEKFMKNHPYMKTMGDVFAHLKQYHLEKQGKIVDYSGNKSIFKDPIPTPYAQESSSVQNAHSKSTVANNTILNFSNLHVHANNPGEMMIALKDKTKYNQWYSTSTGQIA